MNSKMIDKHEPEPCAPPTRIVPPSQMFSPPQVPPLKQVPEEIPTVPFGWETQGNVHLPYILRNTDKYVAFSAFITKHLPDVFKFLNGMLLKSLVEDSLTEMTVSEALTFNQINEIHCEGKLVENTTFSPGQVLMNLDDFRKCVTFFQHCYELVRFQNLDNGCFGFLRIANENAVPFVIIEGGKFVPMFYLEDESGFLESKSLELKDKWKLRYLKILSIIQNVNKIHYDHPSLKVVNVVDIMAKFPEGTSIELYWPQEFNRQNVLAPEINVAALHGLQPSPSLLATPPILASGSSAPPTPSLPSGTVYKPQETQSKPQPRKRVGSNAKRPSKRQSFETNPSSVYTNQRIISNVPTASPVPASSPDFRLPSPHLPEARMNYTSSSVPSATSTSHQDLLITPIPSRTTPAENCPATQGFTVHPQSWTPSTQHMSTPQNCNYNETVRYPSYPGNSQHIAEQSRWANDRQNSSTFLNQINAPTSIQHPSWPVVTSNPPIDNNNNNGLVTGEQSRRANARQDSSVFQNQVNGPSSIQHPSCPPNASNPSVVYNNNGSNVMRYQANRPHQPTEYSRVVQHSSESLAGASLPRWQNRSSAVANLPIETTRAQPAHQDQRKPGLNFNMKHALYVFFQFRANEILKNIGNLEVSAWKFLEEQRLTLLERKYLLAETVEYLRHLCQQIGHRTVSQTTIITQNILQVTGNTAQFHISNPTGGNYYSNGSNG